MKRWPGDQGDAADECPCDSCRVHGFNVHPGGAAPASDAPGAEPGVVTDLEKFRRFFAKKGVHQ